MLAARPALGGIAAIRSGAMVRCKARCWRLPLRLWRLAGAGAVHLAGGVAVWQLELVNYVEHYGLTRRYLGEGRYEHVLPRHSWNAAHKASNWLLINLQRHSPLQARPPLSSATDLCRG